MHYEEFGDRLIGVFAGYLIYTGLVPEGPHAIQVLEKQTGRQMGTVGREIVAATLSEQPASSTRRMTDRIRDRSDLAAELGVHGVLPEEQARPQPFEVDVELEVDVTAAGASDDLDDTVDYAAVSEAIARVVSSERYQLARATRDADR